MIWEEEYDALIARLDAPENAKRKKSLSFKSNGCDLTFHLMRIKRYIEEWSHSDATKKKLLELDYTVSLRNAKDIMDKEGWK